MMLYLSNSAPSRSTALSMNAERLAVEYVLTNKINSGTE